MSKMLVVDTEFTSHGAGSEITELGYLIVDLKTNKIEKHISYILYNTVVKPMTKSYYLDKYKNVKSLIDNKNIVITTVKKALKAFERDLRRVDIVVGYNLTSDLDIINLVCDRLGFDSSINHKKHIDIYFNAIWQLKDDIKYKKFCMEDKLNRISPENRMRFTQDLVYKFLFNEDRKSFHVAYLDCKDTLIILAKLTQKGKIKMGTRTKMYYYNENISL